MKLHTIPLPAPIVMIYLPPRGPRWRQALMLNMTRFALWVVPAITTELVLVHSNRAAPAWLYLTATLLILAIMAWVIGVSIGDEETGVDR